MSWLWPFISICASISKGYSSCSPGSSVVNNSKDPQRAQIVLRCYLEQDGGYSLKHSLTQDTILFETVVQPKTTVILTNLPEFHLLRVPAVYPSFSGVYWDSSKKCRAQACIKWAYTLEIRLPDWGSGFYCRAPFLLTAAPPYSAALQKHRQDHANPQLTGHFSIFDHAVSGILNDCTTGPTFRAPTEDNGRKVLAKDAPPVWMGSRESYLVWMKNEKNRARLKEWIENPKGEFEDLETLFFRNVVNVYAGPSGRLESED